MKRYSQNLEQDYILEYFYKNNFCPLEITVLDIGANDGKTLSNSLSLIENGAKACLVEPMQTPFRKMMELHKDNPKVICLNVAVGTENKEVEFFDSGTHLNQGDTSLLATMHKTEKERWNGSKNTFEQTTAECVTYERLTELAGIRDFDFISIDAESEDYNILKQIDLTNTSVLCIEHNSDKNLEYAYILYCRKYGLNRVIYNNAENIILCR